MITKRDILFTPTGKTRTLHIYLPRGYEFGNSRYPVMYFFDGHNLFSDADATYGKSWGLEAFLDNWEKPMIVIGIECGHEGRERLREYCPYRIKGDFLGEIEGIGHQTLTWMTEELKPLIDREYRTYFFREATGIGGSSMGGLMSLYAAICFNRYFSKAACLSSAISPCVRELTRDIAGGTLSADTRVYLSWGTEEAGGARQNPQDDWKSAAARRNGEVAALLQEKGVNTRLYCQRGGGHCEADWEKQTSGWAEYLWLDR